MLKEGNVMLRALEPEDLEIVFRMENDADMWQYGQSNVPYSRYAIRQYLEQNKNDIFADGQLRMVICVNNDAVGLVDLVNFDARNNRAEVGIAILPEYRSKGFGVVALSLLREYAFDFLRIHQLFAFVSTENKASVKIFQKTGYKEASRLSDWLACGDAFVDAILFTLVNEK